MSPVLAGAAAGLAPPVPIQTLPFQTTADTAICTTDGGPTLVGAIELVSPANKDRRTHRETFVSKCETYLRQGVGLVIVDIVTNRKRNLHNELLTRLVGVKSHLSAALYAVSYRVVASRLNREDALWTNKLRSLARTPDSWPTTPPNDTILAAWWDLLAAWAQ